MATIVFDFDGTLADSLPVVIEVYKQLLPGQHDITPAKIQKLRRMSVQKVTAELGISFWKVPFLLRRGRTMMHARIHDVEIFPGIKDVVKELHTRGYTLYVLSSNSTENVEEFLQQKGLREYFTEVKGINGLFGKAKALKKMAKRDGFDLAKTYYVGDEARDIVAAKHVGMTMVAVAWGFNDKELLRDLKADWLIDEPQDLLKIFPKV